MDLLNSLVVKGIVAMKISPTSTIKGKQGKIKLYTRRQAIMVFEDINTYDKDEVIIEGYNRKEIAGEIKKLLTKQGVKMYGKLHKWRFLE